MDPLQARRGAAAARSIAAAQGLDVGETVVLQDSNKLTVRLWPADIVARVAPVADQDVGRVSLSARALDDAQARTSLRSPRSLYDPVCLPRRPGDARTWTPPAPERTERHALATELELLRRLLDEGSPVVPPDPRLPPRVHEADGFAITFWSYGGVPADAVPAADYARALRRLHTGLRAVDLAGPHVLDRVASAQALVASRDRTPRLAADDRQLLGRTLSRLGDAVASVGRTQLLHGEPHPGNLLDSGAPSEPHERLRFIDLETWCRGPVEFDVAHAPHEVARYCDGLDPVVLRQCRLLMIALVATWRWDADDRLPDGARLGVEWVARLRAALTDERAG